jgi:hypothetical protein
MNDNSTDNAARAQRTSQPDGFRHRAARLLLARPAGPASPVARWAATVLAVAGAALLVWSGVIHLQLWSDGYRNISVIGPLFAIQGAGSIVLALGLAVSRQLALLAAGAIVLAATAGGLLLSASIGLFGYRESLAVPYAETSLVVEFTGAAVLAAAAAIILAERSRQGASRSNPSAPPIRIKECAEDGNRS